MSSVATQKHYFTYRVENESLFLEARGSTIEFPEGAEEFSVSAVDGKMAVRAYVDLTRDKVPYKFYLRPTGLPLDGNEGAYVGTFSLMRGFFVGHLFTAHPTISSPINSKRVIYKFPIPKEGEDKVLLPPGAQKICTFVRRDKPYVYAFVDPTHHSFTILKQFQKSIF